LGHNAAGHEGPRRHPLDRPYESPSPLRRDADNGGDDELAQSSLQTHAVETGHHRSDDRVSNDDRSDDCDYADEHTRHDCDNGDHHDHSDDGRGRNDNPSYDDGPGRA
jgi:hypothetical protein